MAVGWVKSQYGIRYFQIKTRINGKEQSQVRGPSFFFFFFVEICRSLSTGLQPRSLSRFLDFPDL